MKVRNFKLIGDDNRQVEQETTPHKGGSLTGGKPRFLVIHYTAGGSLSSAVRWFQNPAAKASAHLVIGHDGAVVQMAPFDTVTWHAGRSRWRNVKGLNSHSVGIEIANWGKLKRSGAGGFTSWAGASVPAERVILEEHKHAPGQISAWEIFDEPQMMATVNAAKAIVEAYDIKPWDVIGHEDISPIRKVDPGPAFEMDLFRSMVFGRAEDDWNDVLYKVQSPSGLNLRSEPSVSGKVLKNLGDGAVVNVIEPKGNWWLVAEVVGGDDDVTGYVHSHWLAPV